MRNRLSSVIAPSFISVHKDIKEGGHTHYWLKGGRGSTKSSFISAELILGIMRDAQLGLMTNAIVFRRYGVTIRESVYEQLNWAVNALGVAPYWQAGVSPMQLIYTPTGQKIIFRGVDDATKIKSVKAGKGYIKYAWYEEANEFEGPEKIRSINQSVLRGGSDFVVFYSFNPPKAARNWVNQYVAIDREDTLVHHSTYLTVPPEWLGEQFLAEAEHLKGVKPEAYRHEYLGEVTGTGGEVFDNITLRSISDEEIQRFDHIHRGIDWGYAADPFAYNAGHYDKTRRRLYLYYEIHKVRLSNRAAAELVRQEAGNGKITCDSAEPKSFCPLHGNDRVFPNTYFTVIDKSHLLVQPYQLSTEIFNTNEPVSLFAGWQIHTVDRHQSSRHEHTVKLSNDKLKLCKKFCMIPTVSQIAVTV